MLPNIWSRQHSLHCLNKSWNNQSSLNRNLLILWKLTSKSYLFSMPSFRHCTFPTQLASKGIGRRCTCFVSGTYSWYFQKIINMDFSRKYLKTQHNFMVRSCFRDGWNEKNGQANDQENGGESALGVEDQNVIEDGGEPRQNPWALVNSWKLGVITFEKKSC